MINKLKYNYYYSMSAQKLITPYHLTVSLALRRGGPCPVILARHIPFSYNYKPRYTLYLETCPYLLIVLWQ